jgi:antitoxin MazE
MKTRVQKWGNSLAVRLLNSFAGAAGIAQDTPVDISVENGKIVVAPVHNDVPTLEELVSQINARNLHEEISTGPSVGNEVW